MKHKYFLRSTLFNMALFIFNLLTCVSYLPALLLPRDKFMPLVDIYLYGIYFLERRILGLNYEIRGRKYVPDGVPFIIAAKHYSAYETFKLRPLFKEPAIILKRELLRIPLWGYYLAKTSPIAIDRSTPKTALKSITDGAIQVREQGRPLVIFPQGTRVHLHETPQEKPYKTGIARIQAATGLPIIPMATNSGYFCPRGRWLKKPGTVVFEFLPPIAPGKDGKALMTELENKLESASAALVKEAMKKT